VSLPFPVPARNSDRRPGPTCSALPATRAPGSARQVQQVLRPGDLDDPALQTAMQQEALFGECPDFDRARGVQASVSGTALAIGQPNAEITVNEQDSLRVSRPARDAGGWRAGEIPSPVEEDVRPCRGRRPLCRVAAGPHRPRPPAEPGGTRLPTGQERLHALAHAR
jgi:hypothetical protein